jgi:hypothetical protein
MDLVDEEHVARLEVGEDGGEVAGALDDGAGSGAEANPEFTGDNLGERGFAEAWGAMEQYVVERLAAGAGGFDENGEVFTAGSLAHEFAEGLRAQAGLGGVLRLVRRA